MKTNKENFKPIIFLITTLVIIFAFFFHTIFYPPKAYDELIIFKESYLPSCNSFTDMFELISLLGLKQHFEAGNSLYSNIISFRCNPFGNFIQLCMQVFFKKNPINFHLFSLCLHLVNSTVLFLIITKASRLFLDSSHLKKNKVWMAISLLTIFWALHPVNVESVLLLSNAITLFSYTFSFLTIFIFLNYEKASIVIKSITVFICYLCGLFIAEFHFLMPVILILYCSIVNLYLKKDNKSFIESFKKTIFKAIPLIAAMVIFIISFSLSRTGTNLNTQNDFKLIFERVFWLSPQIYFHFIKLFFFPIKLSLDQSLLVDLGRKFWDPYFIFCIIFLVYLKFLCAKSLFNAKKRFPFFFITVMLFLFSLLPFSQVLAPVYNLASERYLYFPSFVFVFGLSHCVFKILSMEKKCWIVISVLFIVITTFSIRSYIRTFDWKDNYSMCLSSIESAENPILKAQRYTQLYPQNSILAENPESTTPIKYKYKAIDELEHAINIYKTESIKYEEATPIILKKYGLDPDTFLAKSGCQLAESQFDLSGKQNYKTTLASISPYTKDLSKLDSGTISFYSSLLYFNNRINEAENVLKEGLVLYPHSTRLIFPLCDIIQIKSGDIREIENLTLKTFKYYPYDIFTLFAVTKLYELKGDLKNYAHYSYIFGLRLKSIEHLKSAYNAYIRLNDATSANKVKEKLNAIYKKN